MCQLEWVQWCAVVSLVMNNQVLYKLRESILLTKYYLGDQFKSQIGGACSTYGRAKTCIQDFGGGKREEKRPRGIPRYIDGRKILTCLLKKWLQGSGPV